MFYPLPIHPRFEAQPTIEKSINVGQHKLRIETIKSYLINNRNILALHPPPSRNSKIPKYIK